MNLPPEALARLDARRRFLHGSSLAIGGMALGSLRAADRSCPEAPRQQLAAIQRHHAPRARNVIYLHMEGAPPTLDMFDRKPALDRHDGEPCPQEFLADERFAFIKGTPRLLGHQHGWIRGNNGIEVCELFPHLAQQLADVTLVRSMVTDQFNHAPAELLLFSGAPRPGRPSMGSWVSYGLGSENGDLPAFVVMTSGGSLPSAGKALWSSGFAPTVHQGVELRSVGDPVLYLQDPEGYDRARRERSLRAIVDLDREHGRRVGDPETMTRIAQYELAFRMQASVPEAVDLAAEPPEVHELYGTTPGQTSLANNCLLARRLIERGVRFVNLFDAGWDIHGTNPSDDLMTQFPKKARELDRALAGLLVDLRRRGLLDETLVVWGGEFGRTPMNEKRNGSKLLGRDHHPHCFTMLLAGAGIKRGAVVGATDDIGYRVVENPVHVHDLQATILYLLGIDHQRLTYKFQGRAFRLTDVHGIVRPELLA
ncbi:MAG: DUF1501 domain-containing protein [Planctomycetes bacterium]|nr:DUF1501 domain-containing protein [Planctomycetota bacterium]